VSWSPSQQLPAPPPPLYDLRKSKDLVPLVGDGNGCSSRIIVSCDPNAIIFRLAIDPWAESSSDSNLVRSGSGDHVVVGSVGEASQERMANRNERTRLTTGGRAYSESSGSLCLGLCLTRDRLKSRIQHVTVTLMLSFSGISRRMRMIL